METLHGSNTSSAPSFEKTEQELLTHLPPPPSMVDQTVQSSPPAVAQAFPAMTILPYAQPKTSFPVSVPGNIIRQVEASPDSIVVNGDNSITIYRQISYLSHIGQCIQGPKKPPNHHTSSTQSQAPPDEFLVGGHYRGGCDTADIFSDHIEWMVHSRFFRNSIEQHGISLNTLYRLCEEGGPCLIALRDTNSNVFGAFSNESLGPRSGFLAMALGKIILFMQIKSCVFSN
ncbi:hypothetical protein BSLG_005671 [Batrachochytrium salamandrivorans]|nr:hypothetical protein BSLG_005671 [Batrachochytrium salamandrivorans]